MPEGCHAHLANHVLREFLIYLPRQQRGYRVRFPRVPRPPIPPPVTHVLVRGQTVFLPIPAVPRERPRVMSRSLALAHPGTSEAPFPSRLGAALLCLATSLPCLYLLSWLTSRRRERLLLIVTHALLPSPLASHSGPWGPCHARGGSRQAEAVRVALPEITLEVEGRLQGLLAGRGRRRRRGRRGSQDAADVWVASARP